MAHFAHLAKQGGQSSKETDYEEEVARMLEECPAAEHWTAEDEEQGARLQIDLL